MLSTLNAKQTHYALHHAERRCARYSGHEHYSYWRRARGRLIQAISRFRPLSVWETVCLDQSRRAGDLYTS